MVTIFAELITLEFFIALYEGVNSQLRFIYDKAPFLPAIDHGIVFCGTLDDIEDKYSPIVLPSFSHDSLRE